MDHATLPQTITERAESSSHSHARPQEQGWLGWLKGFLPGHQRGAKRGEETPQARFNTVWISREAGSGANIIAGQVADRLKWALYNEEVVEIISRRMQVSQELAPGMIQDWLLPLREQHYAPQETYLEHLEHLIQEVGRVGDAVIVGRGAGFLLSSERTLRVRLVAPVANRAARLADRMNVSVRTARRAAQDLDRRRRQFDWALYRKESDDPHNYHMTLDTTALGLPMCADIITLAIIRGFPPGQFSSNRVVSVDARGATQPSVVVMDTNAQGTSA